MSTAGWFAEQFPCNQVGLSWNKGVVGRCKIGLGSSDAGIQLLEQGVEQARGVHAHLLEMLLSRDLVLLGTGRASLAV